MSFNNKIIDEMLLALKANIEYLSQNGSSQTRVKNGRLIQTVGEKYVYQFDLEFLQNIEPDAEVEVRLGGSTAGGKISALSENSVQIEVDKNLGDKINEALLVISSYYLLEMLQKKLEAIRDGELRLSGLADKLFDSGDFATTVLADYKTPPSKAKLNAYQLDAVRLALGNDVSFIWGPPGTGKTQTIANVTEGFLSQGKSVLLISHTNKATDEALAKTINHLGNENEDYQDGKIVRFGPITLNELKDKYVTPEAIADKQGRSIRAEIKKIEAELAKLNAQLIDAKASMKQYETLQDYKEKIASYEQYLDEQKNLYTQYHQDVKSSHESLVRLKGDLDVYSSKGTLGKLFSATKPETIYEEQRKLNQYIAKRDEQMVEIKRNVEQTMPYLSAYKDAVKTIRENNTLPHKLEYYIEINEACSRRMAELIAEQTDLEKELIELFEKLILEAKIVATTLTKSYTSKTVLSRQYDVVIIDEASMAPLPAVLCAAGLAQKNIVVVGDFLQLPPVVKHKVVRSKGKSAEEADREEQLVRDWLTRDIFAVAGVESGIRQDRAPQKLRQLKRQYRMHSSIADLINKIAYGKFGSNFALESEVSATDVRLPELFTSQPAAGNRIAFYDTSTRSPIASQVDGGSYYNIYNAFVSVELAKQAINSGYSSVGIISAYRAQVNLIQKMVADTFTDPKLVDADTVHRFQGGEKDLVIFDITTPNSPSMYDDRNDEGGDMKLLNVAISRAKEKVLLVGDVRQILKNHSTSSLVRLIINHIHENQLPIYNTEEILDGFRVAEKTDEILHKFAGSKLSADEMTNSELFDEMGFYGQFIADLLSAEKEVIIDSPYMTTKRVEALYPYFEQLKHKGVQIYVLTRVSKEHDGKMQYYSEVEIQRLTKLGVVVLPFVGKIHRKIAIIDREVLWEGSLNILSQSDSREIMRRFVGKQSSKQMMAFLKLDKNLGEIGVNSLRHCEFCEDPLAWYWTDTSVYGGLWTFCLLNRHKSGVPPKTKEQIQGAKDNLKSLRKASKEKADDGSPICPTHNLVMIKRKGRFGDFYGCPKYPACKVTEKI